MHYTCKPTEKQKAREPVLIGVLLQMSGRGGDMICTVMEVANGIPYRLAEAAQLLAVVNCSCRNIEFEFKQSSQVDSLVVVLMPYLSGSPHTEKTEDRPAVADKTVGLMVPNSLESTKVLQKELRQLFKFKFTGLCCEKADMVLYLAFYFSMADI